MIRENENIQEVERLELNEFNLDVEEQMRLDTAVQQNVSRVMQTQKITCIESSISLWGYYNNDPWL